MKFKTKFVLFALLVITLNSCSNTDFRVDNKINDTPKDEIIIDDIIEEKEEENQDIESEVPPKDEESAENDVIEEENNKNDEEENEEITENIPVISEENFSVDETNNIHTGKIQNIAEGTIDTISLDLIDADFQNNGSILINGDFSLGINAVNSHVINNQDITVNGIYSPGISSITPDKMSVLINNGNIYINSFYSRGIFSSNDSSILNDVNGTIHIFGEKSGGISISHNSLEVPAVNKGIIIVNGKDAVGMEAIGGLIINEGKIMVTGENAVGMFVNGFTTLATAVNNGEILVGKNADSAITASGSNAKIINNGIIRLDISHPELENSSAENVVLKALNGAEIINTGTISAEETLILSSDTGSTLKIGTTKNKKYGTFSASEIKINSDIIIDTTIVTSGYKEKYILSDVFEADSVELSDKSLFIADSILYEVNPVKNESGNVNVVLNRTGHTFSSLTDEKYKTTADIFTNAMSTDKYSKLSTEAQAVMDTVFLKSKTAELINKSMRDLSPTLYSYIDKHIINTEAVFQNSLNKISSDMKDGNIGFSLIADFQTDNKNSKSDSQLPEYNSKLGGIAGSIKVTENNYVNIGYGSSSYKENSKNKVNTDSFFLGYNIADISEFSNKNIGFLANYNKNSGKRRIDILDADESTEFNSYSFSLYGNISQKYGKTFTIEPYAKFTALYGFHENINESGKAGSADIESDSFSSVIPAGGIKAGIYKSDFNIYVLGEIGYELMDTTQDKKAVLNGFNGIMTVPAYKNNRTKFNTGAGLNYNFNKFTVSLDTLIDLANENALTGRINMGYSF